MKAMEQCMVSFKRDLGTRVKTPVLVTLAVVVIGVAGAILGSLWQDIGGVDKKVDMIREDQIKVMTTLKIHVDDTNNGDNNHGRP